ncbi:hypothetical protein B0H14DRAFT_104955 [Mycena olivaceomarginata]|nr:hypothetical protein B0H14DRAFT_104955 [Mycena olivaceomarginata]
MPWPLSTKPPRTLEMTRSRRCPSSTRAALVDPHGRNDDLQRSHPSAFSARVCTHLHAPQLGCATPTSRSTRCVHSPSHTPLSSRLPAIVAPALPTLPLDTGPSRRARLGAYPSRHLPLPATAAHLAGVLQRPRCLHRLATHCESSQPRSMQECAYRPNALLARIGRTTRTTTVCSVHGGRFSSPTRRRPAPPLWIAAACTPLALPAWPERRVRDAPQLPALPATRAGFLQLHDAEPDAFSDCEATPRLEPHHTYATEPRTPYHAHALNTRLPRTLETTRSRRCPSSTRAALVDPTGATTIFA